MKTNKYPPKKTKKQMKFYVQNEWTVAHNFTTILLSPSSIRWIKKKLYIHYSLPDFVQTFTDTSK